MGPEKERRLPSRTSYSLSSSPFIKTMMIFLKGETGAVDQKAKSARGNRPHGGTRSLSSHLSSLCSYIIRRRVYGNMAGLEDDDSLDSDSDMLLDGECLNDDDDDNTLLGGNYY